MSGKSTEGGSKCCMSLSKQSKQDFSNNVFDPLDNGVGFDSNLLPRSLEFWTVFQLYICLWICLCVDMYTHTNLYLAIFVHHCVSVYMYLYLKY